MPRQFWNDGQELVQSDLSATSAQLERELYDRFMYELRKRQQNFCFGDSYVCSNVNATTSKVKAGNGAYFDNTQVDPEPQCRLLYLAADTNVTHATADPSHNRIDLIYIQPGRTNSLTATRNFKDAGSGNVTAQSMTVETDWLATVNVVTGTPGVSPAVPATPAGAIALGQVLVTASTGIGGASAYTDVRPRYQYQSSWRKVVQLTSVNSPYFADLDDEIIECNCTGGAIIVYPPLAANAKVGSYAKQLKVTKSDSSANAVTLGQNPNGADLISGQATQQLPNQYDAADLWSDGASWYLG